MSDGLNVVALISGGKDSLFSLLHCIQNGHKVVALANLYPPSQPWFRDEASVSSKHDHGPEVGEHVELESTDLNSFMYQTVGHSLIHLYSTALQLPLYRHQIIGTSVQQSQYYDTSTAPQVHDTQLQLQLDDETEDLVPLLRRVIAAHPEVNAVSTGAILSTYQRTRVESVAVRLGLTPLSFLWQYPVLPPPTHSSISPPQPSTERSDSLAGLLQDIASSGIDARLIKIASAGISENLLFASISDPRTHARLISGLSPFFQDDDEIGLRGAILGEGGEYETIALNGPKGVWKGGRIEVDEAANQSYTEGGVTYVVVAKARVVPHDESMTAIVHHSGSDYVPIPALLDHQFEMLKTELEGTGFLTNSSLVANRQAVNIDTSHIVSPDLPLSHQTQDPDNTTIANSDRCHKEWQIDTDISFTVSHSTVTISNLTAASALSYMNVEIDALSMTSTPDISTAANQLTTILTHLPMILKHLCRFSSFPPPTTTNISSATVLLKSMSDFASINSIYARIYPPGLPNPPARVTIAASLPPGTQISLSLILDLCSNDDRRGLHVQSRSYWAPANIGPYSQAIAVPLRTVLEHQSQNADGSDNTFPVTGIELVHIAGQIPLVPSRMEVYNGLYLDTTVLSLQHLWRVGQERGVDVWPWGVAYLSRDPDEEILTRAEIAACVWTRAHVKPTWVNSATDEDVEDGDDDDEDEPLDVWHVQHNHTLHQGFRRSNVSIGQHLHLLPNHGIFRTRPANQKHQSKYIPPFLAAQVTALPRNVSIEWWSNGIAKMVKSTGTSPTWHGREFSWGSLSCLKLFPISSDTGRGVLFLTCLICNSGGTVNGDADSSLPVTLSDMMDLIATESGIKRGSNTTLVQGMTLTTSSISRSRLWSQLASSSSNTSTLPSQTIVIPCHRLWGVKASVVQGSANVANNASSGNGSDAPDYNGLPLSELAVAFLLRVNIDVDIDSSADDSTISKSTTTR